MDGKQIDSKWSQGWSSSGENSEGLCILTARTTGPITTATIWRPQKARRVEPEAGRLETGWTHTTLNWILPLHDVLTYCINCLWIRRLLFYVLDHGSVEPILFKIILRWLIVYDDQFDINILQNVQSKGFSEMPNKYRVMSSVFDIQTLPKLTPFVLWAKTKVPADDCAEDGILRICPNISARANQHGMVSVFLFSPLTSVFDNTNPWSNK